MIKGFIIDMDGTILDSMKIWENAAIILLKNKGIIGGNELIDILAPLSIKEAIDYIKNRYTLNESASEIQNLFLNIIEDYYLNKVNLKPGVKKFLKKCESSNKNLCLLTANHRDLTIKILTKHKLINYFDQIITCDDTTLTKQDCNIYKFASKQLNLKVSECIVIEDALHAINTAKKAGFIVWGVADQSNFKDWEKIRSVSDLTFENMEFMEVL